MLPLILFRYDLQRIQREEEDYIATVAAEAEEREKIEQGRRAEFEKKKMDIIEKQARVEAVSSFISFRRFLFSY